jgi:hypothetical protein
MVGKLNRPKSSSSPPLRLKKANIRFWLLGLHRRHRHIAVARKKKLSAMKLQYKVLEVIMENFSEL